MGQETSFDLDEAARCAAELAEISERGQLAGMGLAQPLLRARRNQLERERQRILSRFGAGDGRLQALEDALARTDRRIEDLEITTESLSVDTPATPESGGVVFGRVSESGRGRPGLVVAALDPQGKVVGFGCTEAAGAFVFALPAADALRLRVTEKGGATLWRDGSGFKLAEGERIRRDIELSAAAPPCPMPGDDSGGPPETVLVPDLIGREEAEAVRLLNAADLKRGRREESVNPERAGLVVAQSPEGGIAVTRQTAVNIIVAVESDLTMPSLKNLPLEAALARVKDLGLNAEDPTVTPSAEFEGRVIDHTPPAGARVRPGDGVALLVGGPPRVTVPDLRGMPRQEAEARLRELGLRAAEPQFIEDGEQAGRVIRQQPLAGVQLDPGAAVTLFIGRAPDQGSTGISVPELRGTPLDAALERLTALRLNLSDASFQRDPDRAGQVLEQRPEPAAVVEKDSGVTVVVGSGVEATDVTSVVQLVARDPDVARQGLTAERLLEGLRRNDVTSLERLREVLGSEEATGATFGVEGAANTRRLRRAFTVVISRLG